MCLQSDNGALYNVPGIYAMLSSCPRVIEILSSIWRGTYSSEAKCIAAYRWTCIARRRISLNNVKKNQNAALIIMLRCKLKRLYERWSRASQVKRGWPASPAGGDGTQRWQYSTRYIWHFTYNPVITIIMLHRLRHMMTCPLQSPPVYRVKVICRARLKLRILHIIHSFYLSWPAIKPVSVNSDIFKIDVAVIKWKLKQYRRMPSMAL